VYIVTYNESTIIIGGNDTMISIPSLEPFSVYFIAITACTIDGCGNQTDFVIGTTEEEGTVCCISISSYCKVTAVWYNSTLAYVDSYWDEPE